MKNTWACTIVVAAILAMASAAVAEPSFNLVPSTIYRGSAAAVVAGELAEGTQIWAKFGKRPIHFYKQDSNHIGLFGAGVLLKPGKHTLRVSWREPNKKISHKNLVVNVVDKDYGTRKITVKNSQVNLSKEDLARHRKERKLINAALAVRSGKRLWSGPWLRPTDGPEISAFGRKTVINGSPRKMPHSGVDLDGKTGDPIAAPARGKVVLAGEHFFAGGSVYLDHGQGLITMYFHMSEILVKTGDMVEQGQIIGKMGETGRVTGPHLHYGLYLNGARIAPLSFHELIESRS